MVWEKALITDRTGPNTRALRRILDRRATQFWDKDRLLSHDIGESKTGKMIWDWAALYRKGVIWNSTAPQPVFSGSTVIATINDLDAALSGTL